MCLVILLALSIVVKRKRLSYEFHKKILNRWRNENSKIPFSINLETHQKALTYDFTYVTQQSTFLYHTNWHIISKALRYVTSFLEQCNASKSAYWMTELMQKLCNWLHSYTLFFIRTYFIRMLRLKIVENLRMS